MAFIWVSLVTFKNEPLLIVDMATYYITTAIDYTNGKPHIGHAYEKVIADALARWHKLLGDDVFFLTGTDEHGQKIERTAQAAGKTTQEFVDEIVVSFKELCELWNIEYSRFIRTTEKAHEEVAQAIFQKVFDKGDIYLGTYEGLYCVGCEAFYTERDAPGKECPIHKKPLEEIKEESYFFRMSRYEKELIKYIEETDFIQPAFRKNEILNRVKQGLRDLSVSRTSFSWGIPLPNDPKHVIYVWFDALLNYISGIGYPGPQFNKYWPAQVHIIGKDIAWFHTVIWPTILLAADIPLPKVVHTHGFVNLGGEKLSKSRGIVVDPIELAKKYDVDTLRYFLLREIPAGQDGNFSEDALIERNNADLADSLGNLLQRTKVLITKNFDGEIPQPGQFNGADEDLATQSAVFNEVNELIQKHEWNRAIEKVWAFIKDCNKYIADQEPWKVKNPERQGTILYCLVESLRIISILTYPFIPKAAEKIATQLGQDAPISFTDAVFRKTTTGKIVDGEILFKKLEAGKDVVEEKEEQDPLALVNLKVGVVKKVEDHPNADKLFVVTVDLGTEERQLCAGIKEFYQPDELTGKNVVVVSNLKPAKLRGVESQGMLLAAEKDGVVKVVEAPNAEAGSPVTIEGIAQCEKEITIDQFAAITLTTKDNKVIYNDAVLKSPAGEIIVEIVDGATIR